MTFSQSGSPMKNSAIPWVGLMPEDWKVKRAKFLFSLAQRPPRSEDGIVTAFRDGQVTLRANRRTAGFTNATKEAGYQGVRTGDLVIHAMDAFAGAIGVSDSDGKCTPVYSCCIPRAGATSEFYARCVRTMATTGYIESLAKGIRERSTDFRWATFAEQLLPMPPRAEQDAIVTFLDRATARIDALIAKKTRFIELLGEKRQALITHAVTKGLDPAVPMKDSGVEWIGRIPAHWVCAQIRRITISRCDGPFGSLLKSNTYTDEGARVIRLQNIGLGRFKANNTAYISFDYWQTEIGGGHDVLPGDLLMAGLGDENNPLGRACVAPAGISPALVKADCYRFRLTSNVDATYIALTLSTTAPHECALLANGATRERLNLGLACARVVPVPPLAEQRSIVAELEATTSRIDTLIAKTERSIELLREHRTALITAAVTGKIDLRDAA